MKTLISNYFFLTVAVLIFCGCDKPCISDSGCSDGARCNTKLTKPICQKLYTGNTGFVCSDNCFCESQNCYDGKCNVCPVDSWFNGGACSKKIEGGGQCSSDESCLSDKCEKGYCWIDCKDGMIFEQGECIDPKKLDWVQIPGGTFQMGSIGGDSDEKPVHQVTIQTFEMTRTEVTVKQYRRCVDAGVCSLPSQMRYCTWGKPNLENHPVNCVNWDQGVAYANWAGGRLPTEAEWEYAARGTDGRTYPWGNQALSCDLTSMSRCNEGAENVCSKSPAGDSPFGLCDMAGNFYEWVSDWYLSNFYSNSPSSNPTGPSTGTHRIIRGGWWGSTSTDGLRASDRNGRGPTVSSDSIGFRCARDVAK